MTIAWNIAVRIVGENIVVMYVEVGDAQLAGCEKSEREMTR
jgi:hypothetical protein